MKRSAVLLFLPAFLFSCSGNHSAENLPSVLAGAPPAWVLEDLSGTVLIQYSGKAAPDPAVEDQTIGTGDEIITRAGSEASLTLNETTLFHVSENSDVRVDQLADNDTGGFVSRLALTAGKVLCEVEKLSKTGSTFEVESGGVVCGVRGTCFEVDKNDSDLQASTYEGAVEVKKDDGGQTVGAGEHGTYSFGQGAFQPQRPLTQEEQASYESWKPRAALVKAKARERLETLRSLDRLPADQREKILQGLNGTQGGDRQRMILQSLRNPSAPSQPEGNPAAPSSRPQAAPPPEKPVGMPQRPENNPPRPLQAPQGKQRKP